MTDTGKHVWYLEGVWCQWLDEVTEAGRKRGTAEIDVEYWTARRDDAIRRLLASGVPVKAIVSASGLTRGRVYQIRDRH